MMVYVLREKLKRKVKFCLLCLSFIPLRPNIDKLRTKSDMVLVAMYVLKLVFSLFFFEDWLTK